MKLLIVAIAFLLSACASGPSLRQSQYEAGRKEIIDSYVAVTNFGEESVSKTVVPAALKKANECRGKKLKAAAVCESELTEIFKAGNAKLMLRYRFADFNEAQLKCQADKEFCAFEKMELELMRSHQEHVMKSLEMALLDYDSRYANEIQTNRTANFLQGFAQGANSTRKISCASNALGNTVYTDCQ